MTQQELDALKALADSATPGPWEEVATSGEWWITGPDIFQDAVMRIDDAELSQVDAAFIAAARAAVPALIAEVERLRAAIRDADTLEELTHLAGPTDAENEAARKRIEQMDAINAQYGADIARWPDHAYQKWTRISIEQNAYERRYA